MWIQRKFALDNPALLGIAEDESDSESISDEHASSGSRPNKRKRKAKAAGGRIAKGEDFWGKVDRWFKKEVGLRGRNLAGPQWKE